jgi:hypothetical protein
MCAVKTEPAKQPKVRKNQKRPLWPKVRQVSYKNGTKAWLVDGRIMRNRKTFGTRYFFRMKAQAETKADQLRTLRRSEGASALPGKTMVQMGHTNPRTFHAHYRARVTPAAADKYWQIQPV